MISGLRRRVPRIWRGDVREVVARNTALQLAAQIVTVATGLASSMVLSRYLGAEGFGRFTYVFAFYFFFIALTELGMNTVLVREASQPDARHGELIGAAVTLRVIGAVLVMIVAWILIATFAYDPALRRALLTFSLILPLSALQVPAVIFQVRLRLVAPVIIGIAVRLAGLALVLLAVKASAGLTTIVGTFVAAEILNTALLWMAASRLVTVRPCVDPAMWGRLLRACAPIGITGLFVALINRVDFLMLERFTSLQDVGFYGAAYKVTTTLEAFPLLVFGSLYPLMARYAATDPGRLRRVYYRATLGLAAIGVLIGVTTTVLAPWIVRVLFGPAFAPAAAPLAVLVWASVCVYAALAGGNLLISVGRERVSLWANGAGMVLNVALNLFLIPRFGAVGAAAATAVTFACILTVVTVASLSALHDAGVPLRLTAPDAAPEALRGR